MSFMSTKMYIKFQLRAIARKTAGLEKGKTLFLCPVMFYL